MHSGPALGPALDLTCTQGYLPDPGLEIHRVAEMNKANSSAYILALSSRLINLGYVRDTLTNRSKSRMDPYLANAVRKFQRDAGLDQDRWAGPVTWKALDQLVSFENEQEPETWAVFGQDDPGQSPALARAVYLRLFVLGFLDTPLTLQTDLSLATHPNFRDGLTRFLDAALSLGLVETLPAPALSLETVRPLFAQDRLVRSLANHPQFVTDPAHTSLVDAVARIELWLAGFEVLPGAPTARLKKRAAGLRRLTPLSQAMIQFWKTQPFKSRPPILARDEVSPAFFRVLVRMEDEAGDASGLEQDLTDQVCALSGKDRETLMDRVKDVATSIWDGFKRVVRWLARGIRWLFSQGAAALKNLARYIARKARLAFEPVRKAVEILHRGMIYLKGSLFDGSVPGQRLISHDRDFDLRLVDAPRGMAGVQKTVLEGFCRSADCFNAACRLLGHLAAIFREVVLALATGPASWFAVLLSLTRLGRHFAALGQTLSAMAEMEIDPRVSPFSNPVS